MRVFVTGIAGFAGPVVAAALLEAGHVVHGLVRGAGPWPRLAGLPLAPGALHRGDLADGRFPDLVRLDGAQHVDERELVEQVRLPQIDAVAEMRDALEVLRARPAHHADDPVALLEQQLGQVRPVLARDAGDERRLHGTRP